MTSRESHHIGLFGGTFDPVHEGHLALAGQVLHRCGLDRLIILPALAPPHKRQPEASFTDRAAMLTAALADCPDRERIELSLIEGELPAPSYTINTVHALMARHGRHRYYLVLGADMLLDLPHWHRARELLALVSLIAVSRDNLDDAEFLRTLARLDPTLTLDPASGHWVGRGGNTVTYLRDLRFPVSSSTIRGELRRGRIPAMLPPTVLAYIQQHLLYGWSPV